MKKMIAVLTILSLLACILASCGGDATEPRTSTPTKSSASTKAESTSGKNNLSTKEEQADSSDEDSTAHPLAEYQFFYTDTQALEAAALAANTIGVNYMNLGDFTNIDEVDTYNLMSTAAHNTQPITNTLWEIALDDKNDPTELSDPQMQLLAEAKSIATKEFLAEFPEVQANPIPGESAWYGKDIDATLRETFGEWPAEGKSYIDYFASSEVYRYVAEHDILMLFHEISAHEQVPMVLAMEQQGDTLVCEIMFIAQMWFSPGIEGEEPLTKDNFSELTEGYTTFTYTYATVGDEMIITAIQQNEV